MNRKILIASFVFKDRKKWFLKDINKKFDLKESDVFIFENLNDKNQLIFTFHLNLQDGEKLDIKKEFKSAIIVHKKKTTFYTINAMNKAIEVDNDLEGGNIDYRKYKMNWEKYHNQIILVSNNNLALINIKRFFL